MLFSTRPFAWTAAIVSFGVMLSACESVKATDKFLTTPKHRAGSVRELPTEFVGRLPTTVDIAAPTVTPGPVIHQVQTLAPQPQLTFVPHATTPVLATVDQRIDPATLSSAQVRQLQQGLIDQGLNPGGLSGVFGRQTSDALGAYMTRNHPGLPLQRQILQRLGVTL